MRYQSTSGYTPIPDEEDVTPVSNSFISTISRRAKKSLNILAISVIVIIIAAVVIVYLLKVKSTAYNSVSIYQTTPEYNHQLSEISIDDMRRSGFTIGRLAFGNAQCTTSEQNENVCIPPSRRTAKIEINSKKVYQEILGFGGAFTEASAYNFFRLPPKIQKKFIDLYFGKNGIGYSLGRIHINSCDFSLSSYSFDEVPGDLDLQYFDTEVTHDNAQILPLIRLAMDASDYPIRLLASPWSPPAWMKAAGGGYNQSMLGSATPNGLIDSDDIKTTWARYISKFISAYTYKGVNIWAVTPQNEPEFPAPWEACSYTADYEKDFISAFLGPTLRAEHPSVLLLGFDHNKDHLRMWSDALLKGRGHKMVDGMAFHWYAPNDDRHLDGTFGFDNVCTYH
jgi:O-glycosyl hydrolase